MRTPDLTSLRRPQWLPTRVIAILAALFAGVVSVVTANWAATVIERRSTEGVQAVLADNGLGWVSVAADGLQLALTGTAPTEAARFRAITVAGTAVDPDRVIDAMEVADSAALKAPDFTVEILRNGDGISLIGLVPSEKSRNSIVEKLTALVAEGKVTDMLDVAAHPSPKGWDQAVRFGLGTLANLPRAKVSIFADHVAVTAISDSAQQKARIESDLTRQAPEGLRLALDISAPRPVITPFTLRFLIDGNGARFDACSADSDEARARILAAAKTAGALDGAGCTIGLGVPTPEWANAVTMALTAMKDLGAGSITFSDADISLIAADSVSQATFDSVVGELESNLPEVFSLHAVLTPKPAEQTEMPAIPEFTATLSDEGRLDMRGRLGDEISRDAVENFARSKFGTASVHTATRIAPDMPAGWPVRVLAAIEALSNLHDGNVVVRPDLVKITGVTGSTSGSDDVARILADRLGEGANYDLSIRYDKRFDPLLGLPTPDECVAEINQILTEHKINFEPGSAQITTDGRDTLDRIAKRMHDCDEFGMEIGGHTDSQGREEMNLALSQERAQAIITALAERRVLTGNLRALGFGETVPIADNGTEEGREANRRIEFRLVAAPAKAEGTEDAGTDQAGATEAAGAGDEAATGNEAGAEAGTDADAGADAGTDAGGGTDVGADAGEATGTDAGTDVGADAGTDTETGAETDVAPDESPVTVQTPESDTLKPKSRPAR